MKNHISRTILSIFSCLIMHSCGTIFGLDTFMKKASKPTGTENKYRVSFAWNNGYNTKLTVISKEEITEYFKKNPEIKLDEKSITYTEYKGKSEIQSFEYYGQLNDLVEKSNKKRQASIERGYANVEKLMKSKSTNDNIIFYVRNYTEQMQPRNFFPMKEINPDDIGRYLRERGFVILDLHYMKQKTKECNTYPCIEEFKSFIGSFSYTKTENYDKIICDRAREKLLLKSMLSLCPDWKEDQIKEAVRLCKKCNLEETVSDEIYKMIPFCFNRESFVRIFPNSKKTPFVQQIIDEITSGKRKDERDILAKMVNKSINETAEMVSDIISNKEEISYRLADSNDYEIIGSANIKKIEVTKTTWHGGIDYNTEGLAINIGCNNYKHELDKENDGFSIVVNSNGQVFSSYLDKINLIDSNEIDLNNGQFRNSATTNINFYSRKNTSVELQLKFKKGGSYRIQIYPKD